MPLNRLISPNWILFTVRRWNEAKWKQMHITTARLQLTTLIQYKELTSKRIQDAFIPLTIQCDAKTKLSLSLCLFCAFHDVARLFSVTIMNVHKFIHINCKQWMEKQQRVTKKKKNTQTNWGFLSKSVQRFKYGVVDRVNWTTIATICSWRACDCNLSIQQKYAKKKSNKVSVQVRQFITDIRIRLTSNIRLKLFIQLFFHPLTLAPNCFRIV